MDNPSHARATFALICLFPAPPHRDADEQLCLHHETEHQAYLRRAPFMPFLLVMALLMTETQQGDETLLDRFSLSARQALFFTRASVQGDVIELRHLASGLAQGGNDLTKELLAGKRLELPEAEGLDRELPFSREVARALRNAIEEADRLGHRSVTSDHLLLGLLHEGFAIDGLILDEAREIVRDRSRHEPLEPPGTPARPRQP